MRNAVVIGRGMVGNATMHAFGIDAYISKTKRTVSEDALKNYKYYFLCLPTPTIDGVQDDSLVRDWIVKIARVNKDAIIIIRSTVLPGFCNSFSNIIDLVHVPEFLTEKTWKEDIEWPDIVVVGSNNDKFRDDVIGLFKARYKGAEFFITDTITSETIKYAINCLYTLKVVFANQIFDFCQQSGANYSAIKQAMYARKWIGNNHLDVWHKEKRGAGGKCLEKDMEAFSKFTNSVLLIVTNKLNKLYLDENKKIS